MVLCLCFWRLESILFLEHLLEQLSLFLGLVFAVKPCEAEQKCGKVLELTGKSSQAAISKLLSLSFQMDWQDLLLGLFSPLCHYSRMRSI